MKYIAEVQVMPHKELLDPQGKAVANNMINLGIDHILDIRIGKHILIHFEAENDQLANDKIQKACAELLANPIMESFQYSIRKA